MPERIAVRVDAALRARVFPGCAIALVRAGEETKYHAAGNHTYDVNARPVRENTLYDLASVTKSIPTASLASVLAREGKLSLEENVREYLPNLENDFGARVRDLLSYRVAGVRMSQLKELSAEEMLSYIMRRGFDGPPGEMRYTNLPALLLGLVIETAMRTNLDILARKYFFDPLQMHDTVFYAGATLARAVPTELEDWRGMVAGVTHDESACVLARAGHISGHAGLFSTASDLARFITMVLEQKSEHARAIADSAQAGEGWHVNEPYFMGSYAGPQTFGKTGFTGTSVLIDRERGFGLVILSNRTYPKRPHDAADPSSAMNIFRRDIADIVFASFH